MGGSDHLLDELAAAVIDGEAIDWAAAADRADAATRPFLTELRLLESVAAHHRESPQPADGTSPATMPGDDEAGGTWGHLRLLDRVGAGAFGVVYRAWDTRLDREVALKLQAHLPGSAGDASPDQEGRVLARVRHPNVVTVYGAERRGDQVGLWMEFVHGHTLQRAIADGRTFHPHEVVAIGLELARALSAVHDAGLVHGDVKAQNVMLADDGRVVLMDFGTGHDLAQAPTVAGGTPLYLAPERLRGEPASVRTDIYAEGVVLFHLLTGAFPVEAGDLEELCRAHAAAAPRAIRTLRPDLEPTLSAVVDRATHPDLARRHADARALADDLARIASPPKRNRAVLVSVAVALAWVAVEAGRWGLGLSSPALSLLTAVAPGRGGPAPGALASPVIVVQPFTNLGRDAGTELIVDGLTAEILHQLAIIDGLHVKSWDSSVAMRDRPLAEVRDRLGATLVLQGQVLWAGARVRLNVQLVDVSNGVPLWSDRFDSDVADVLAVQDRISRAIVNRLRLKLGTGQRRYDADPQAYELYLKARALAGRRGFEDPATAANLFTQVIARDAAFAPAYAGLANAHAWLSMFPLQTRPLSDALVVMKSAATTALELDPRLAEAHAAMGWVRSRERDWRGAEASFERAIALDPSLVSTHVGYAFSTLKPQERFADAERVLKLAVERDPLSLEVARELGLLYLAMGRFTESMALLESVRNQDERLPLVRRDLGRALIFAGRAQEAIALLEETMSQHYLAHALVRAGRGDEAKRLYATHQAVANRKAVIAAALGDVDATFDALERMMIDEPHRVAQHLFQPEFALLRGNPRRTALRRTLGLEP